MRIVFAGHPFLARRQWSFAELFSFMGHDVSVIAPKKWGRFVGKPEQVSEKVRFYTLPVINEGNLHRYYFKRESLLRKELADADVVVSFMEPWSYSYSQIVNIVEQLPEGERPVLVGYTYENLEKVRNYHVYNNFQIAKREGKQPSFVGSYEDNIVASDIILCGNKTGLEFMRKEIDYFGGATRTYMIPHTGVDSGIFYVDDHSKYDKETLVFSGRRSDPLKRFDLAIEIAGKTGKKLHYWDFIPDESYLQPQYTVGKTLIHTSVSSKSWSEQLGFVIAEALMCGLYVVASVDGSPIDWFEDVVMFADPHQPETYVEKIEELELADPPNLIGSNWASRNFSNHAVYNKYMEVIKLEL